ncbi:helix-turn-helix domain-containing protein [Escherichia coli]|uniref:helix-turn-helix domain-containing protein n=1 Tax=Escherichia coli TaxID=562 RepID=UPI001582C6BA|nr:helix-turn-helix domain-containing protein [Escherichia coli]EFI4018518.1 helix-turn-helix domain-containing protein [Escherichia coli]EIG3850521.1 helix-turn-helix domain-containing protein [Escherichia coli]ELE4573905.1 helix-turn-helix domain-containing protein [Escherichia coli]HAZ7277889.1 helix-turn-helix domain-containing protein [Escherichia coli]
MTLSEKIKAIRQHEGLSRVAFCQLIDLSVSTLEKYEMGKFEPGGAALTKIAQHPRFQKYTLWLMSDITAPEAGQIAPVVKEDKKTG